MRKLLAGFVAGVVLATTGSAGATETRVINARAGDGVRAGSLTCLFGSNPRGAGLDVICQSRSDFFVTVAEDWATLTTPSGVRYLCDERRCYRR